MRLADVVSGAKNAPGTLRPDIGNSLSEEISAHLARVRVHPRCLSRPARQTVWDIG